MAHIKQRNSHLRALSAIFLTSGIAAIFLYSYPSIERLINTSPYYSFRYKLFDVVGIENIVASIYALIFLSAGILILVLISKQRGQDEPPPV